MLCVHVFMASVLQFLKDTVFSLGYFILVFCWQVALYFFLDNKKIGPGLGPPPPLPQNPSFFLTLSQRHNVQNAAANHRKILSKN